ncbi:MAG: apolipoprotein N-acyltransferase [Cyanobacteriota bacterium]|nr:apolipoprotein N-acyltransferase [Cyanobacteriota bacterium]
MGDHRHTTAPAALAAAGLPAVLAGALAGLALPPLGSPLLLWPALAVLWELAGDPPSAASAPALRRWAGLLWGLAAVLVSHRWLLWLHPLDWVGVPAPLSLPICLLLWLACGLLGGLLVQLWLLLARRADASQAASAVALACLWGLGEVLLARGPLFWIGLGSSALPSDLPLAGLAALGGAGLVAAVQLLLGWCLWRLLRQPAAFRRWLPLGLLLLLAGHGLGAAALAGQQAPEAAQAQERLLVLQPAIPTREKFEVAQQHRLLRQLDAAQQRAAALLEAPQGPPAIPGLSALVLPEGALALDQPLPGPAPVEVLSGGFRRQGPELRSSLLRFPPGSRVPLGWVDKHRVVPLGEWLPLASLWRWSGLSAVGGIEPGPPSRLLARPAGAIGVAICYELADGTALARASREGARWLLASANLDPYPRQLQEQFLALARLRAIESGRWLVAAANTGPSLAVDPAGRVHQRLPAGEAAEAVIQLRQRTALTPYSRWGEWPLLLFAALAAGWRLSRLTSRRPPGRPR